ncbi:MAG: universal stress protein [Pseudomonadota bacterium]
MAKKTSKHDGSTASSRERTYLVVVDDSDEFQIALEYTYRRVCKIGGNIALLHTIEDDQDFHHWTGVRDLMIQEKREEAEQLMQRYSDQIYQRTHKLPVLHIRNGKIINELLALLDEERSISVVVLGASSADGNPGPIITQAILQNSGKLRVPFIIVPGHLSNEELDHIT